MSPYRNQSIDLLCKSIDWFLYGGALAFNKLRPIFSMSPLMHNVEKCSNMLINFAVITRIRLVIFQHNAWKGWIEIIQLIYTHINRLVSFLLVKRFCHSQGNNSKLYYFIVTFQYLPQMSFFDNALQEAQLKEDYVSKLQNNFPWIKVVQFVILVRPVILQLACVTNIPML